MVKHGLLPVTVGGWGGLIRHEDRDTGYGIGGV